MAVPRRFNDTALETLPAALLELERLIGQSQGAERGARQQDRPGGAGGLKRPPGRPVGPESGLTRFAIRYMCTHHYFSIDRARRELHYTPAINIDEGIRRTIAAASVTA